MKLEYEVNEMLRVKTTDSYKLEYSYRTGECCLIFSCEGGGSNEGFEMELACLNCVALSGILYAHDRDCLQIKLVEELPEIFEDDLDEGYITLEIYADRKRLLSVTCFEIEMRTRK